MFSNHRRHHPFQLLANSSFRRRLVRRQNRRSSLPNRIQHHRQLQPHPPPPAAPCAIDKALPPTPFSSRIPRPPLPFPASCRHFSPGRKRSHARRSPHCTRTNSRVPRRNKIAKSRVLLLSASLSRHVQSLHLARINRLPPDSPLQASSRNRHTSSKTRSNFAEVGYFFSSQEKLPRSPHYRKHSKTKQKCHFLRLFEKVLALPFIPLQNGTTIAGESSIFYPSFSIVGSEGTKQTACCNGHNASVTIRIASGTGERRWLPSNRARKSSPIRKLPA